MPKKLSAAAKRALGSAKKNRGTKKLAAKANKARKGKQGAMIAKVGRASRSDVAGARSVVAAVGGKKGSKTRKAKVTSALKRSGLMQPSQTQNTGSARKDLAKASLFRRQGRKNRQSLKAGSSGNRSHDG